MKRASPNRPAAAGHSPSFYAPTALIIAGASASIVTLLSGRLLEALFTDPAGGHSTLAAAALAAVAAGATWGGRQADRNPYLILLSRLLIGAGITVAAIPFVRAPVLVAAESLGASEFLAAAALAGPALALLGAVGPMAARLAVTGAGDSGRRFGEAVGLAAIGAASGGLLAARVLIPFWPPARGLFVVAAALIAWGAFGTWLSARRIPLGQLATCAAGFALLLSR